MPARDARLAEGHACADGSILECAVSLVAVQAVRLGVVGDENIDPSVAVEVEHGDAQSLRRRVVHAGLPRHVLERSVAAIVKKRRTLALVRLRRAVGFIPPVERAVQVLLDRPLDVVGHEQVEPAVVVVIEPERARGKPRVADAGLRGHVEEMAAAQISEQSIAPERRQVHVDVSVVVVVGGGGPDSVQFDVESRAGGDVGERAVVLVAIHAGPRPGPGMSRPALRVDKQRILPSVSVEIGHEHTRAHGLGQVLPAKRPVGVCETDARLRRDVREGNRWSGCSGGSQNEARDDQTEGGAHALVQRGRQFSAEAARLSPTRAGVRCSWMFCRSLLSCGDLSRYGPVMACADSSALNRVYRTCSRSASAGLPAP